MHLPDDGKKSRRRADYLTRLLETAALIFRAAVSISFFYNFFRFHQLKKRSTQLRSGTSCGMNFSGNKKAECPLQDT